MLDQVYYAAERFHRRVEMAVWDFECRTMRTRYTAGRIMLGVAVLFFIGAQLTFPEPNLLTIAILAGAWLLFDRHYQRVEREALAQGPLPNPARRHIGLRLIFMVAYIGLYMFSLSDPLLSGWGALCLFIALLCMILFMHVLDCNPTPPDYKPRGW